MRCLRILLATAVIYAHYPGIIWGVFIPTDTKNCSK